MNPISIVTSSIRAYLHFKVISKFTLNNKNHQNLRYYKRYHLFYEVFNLSIKVKIVLRLRILRVLITVKVT